MNIKEVLQKLKQHLGMSISVFIHTVLFILLLVSFPQCQRKIPTETIISIDLLPIAQVSNIENKQLDKQEPKKEEKPKPEPLPEPKPEPKPEQKEEKPVEKPKPEPEPVPEPKKEEVKKPVEKPKSEPKPEPKPKPAPKKEEKKKKPAKPKISDVDKILKNMEDLVKKNDTAEEKSNKRSKGPHNSNMPLSLSVRDSIRRQVEQCWSPPAGNKDAAKLQILLRISLKRDGSVASARVVDNIRYNSSEIYRVAADAAVRAVYKASPLQNLPVEQYNMWQDLEFNFDPSTILGD